MKFNKPIRGILTFSDNLANYLLFKKPKRGPLFVSWDITSKCNSRCAYCRRWRLKLQRKKELGTKQRLEIVRQLGKSKVWMISFCGGEPLLMEDLGIIIKEAKRQKMLVNLSTNGLLLKKKAQLLVDSGVDSVIISVESHIPKIHDSIRGVKGSFNRLKEGIDLIKKLRHSNLPTLAVRLIVNKKTCQNLGDYIKYWKPRVDEIILQPIHENPVIAFKIPKNMRLPEEDKERFSNNFNNTLKKHKLGFRGYYKEFPAFFFNKKELAKKYRCFAGYFYLDIDAQGNVYPCGEHIKNLGNLTKHSFVDTWQGKRLNQFRKIIRAHKNKCICWYNCSMLNAYLSKLIPF